VNSFKIGIIEDKEIKNKTIEIKEKDKKM